jgi:hypothetical protein
LWWVGLRLVLCFNGCEQFSWVTRFGDAPSRREAGG